LSRIKECGLTENQLLNLAEFLGQKQVWCFQRTEQFLSDYPGEFRVFFAEGSWGMNRLCYNFHNRETPEAEGSGSLAAINPGRETQGAGWTAGGAKHGS